MKPNYEMNQKVKISLEGHPINGVVGIISGKSFDDPVVDVYVITLETPFMGETSVNIPHGHLIPFNI